MTVNVIYVNHLFQIPVSFEYNNFSESKKSFIDNENKLQLNAVQNCN